MRRVRRAEDHGSTVQAGGPRAPGLMPVLSRGKHRNALKGACFMELAGYLAGEKWSDHPKCTHPLLAGLARCVNDVTSDEARSALAPMVPSVIGLTSDDPRVDARLALVCAQQALPVVALDRQRVLAVGILAAERALARIDGQDAHELSQASRRALAEVPHAQKWAYRFAKDLSRSSVASFRRYAAPRIVVCSVQGVAQACVPDPDALLRRMLGSAIEEARRLVPAAPEATVDEAAWAQAYELTLGRHRQ